jgi:hypothetical protein
VQQLSGTSTFNATQAVTLTLTSSDPTKVSVPATVTIPAGQSSVYFEMTGVDLTSTPVTIDVSASGYTSPATKLSVSVVTPTFGLCGPESPRTVVSGRDDVYLCTGYQAYSYIYYPTSPAANLTIDWSIVEDNPVGIVPGFYSASSGGTAVTQSTWTAPAAGNLNSNSGSVWIGTPTAAGTYKVRGAIAGLNATTSGTVTVAPPALRFYSSNYGVNPSNSYAGKGFKTYQYELQIQRVSGTTSFNGTEPVTINLACTSTAICRVPATVTIAAGQSSAYFQVEGVDIGSTTITAWATGYTSAPDLPITVVTPTLNFSNLANVTVGQNRSVSVYACVSNTGYSCSHTAISPLTIDLVSSAPGVATVPATATISAGATYSNNFNVTGVSAGQTTITASGAGLQSTSGTISVTQ